MSPRTRPLEQFVPAVGAARSYRRAWLRSDLVAGLVLAAILVPQGMAYAELAGLPAVTGLYTTIGCLVGYAIFGPSRVLVLGPDSSVSPLIFAAIIPLGATDDPQTAIALAGMLALLVGLIEIALGIGRLGFVADLLSSEVQVGYMNGLAITIIVGQLPKLFGFSTDADSFFDEIRAFVDHLDATEWAALAVGVAVLAVLLGLPKLTTKVPAVLVGVVGATTVSALLGLSDEIATVGTLPSGFPKPDLPWTQLSDVGPLLIAAVGITLVSLTDTIATSAAFAAKRGDEVDPNQEMVGIGAANLAAGMVQGFAVSTSGSRTAVAEQSGAKSQLTGLVGAGIVAVLLLFFNGLLADLPQSALAAVVIAAALSLLDLGALLRYWKVRRSAVLLSIVASLGVILLGVLEGIVVAIFLAVLLFFRRSWWPHGAVLGEVEDLDGWHSVDVHPEARELPGVVVYRWEAPLFFANAGAFRRQVRHLARERRPRWIIVQCEAITDVDVTAAGMLEQVDRELNADGIHMAFVELRSRLQDLIRRYGLYETLDRDHFYPSIDVALAAIRDEDAQP
ncbi:MAG: sodium-independent anion transporter [Acidimicrobiia bacterium]